MRIEKLYTLDCSPSQIYQAWLSEDSVIPPVVSIQSNPKPKGVYKLKTEGAVMVGQFAELIQNKLIKYSWSWEGADEKTMVTVRINPIGNGTAIQLVHEGFNSRESLDMHADGWDTYVFGLEKLIYSKT